MWLGIRLRLHALSQRDDDGWRPPPLLPELPDLPKDRPRFGGGQPVDDHVSIPHRLLEVGYHVEGAQGGVQDVDAEAVSGGKGRRMTGGRGVKAQASVTTAT